jgi:hypothetical protein
LILALEKCSPPSTNMRRRRGRSSTT